MGHDLPFHALILLGVLWLCVLLRCLWPRRRAATDQADGQPATRTSRRSADPPPFPGLTTKPLCAACEQAAQARVAQVSSGPPPLMTSTRGRRRQVATQHQFCPHPCWVSCPESVKYYAKPLPSAPMALENGVHS